MTITETVQGPDGRLYLVLRKIEEPHAPIIISNQEEPEESRVIIIDMNEDDDSIVQFEFN